MVLELMILLVFFYLIVPRSPAGVIRINLSCVVTVSFDMGDVILWRMITKGLRESNSLSLVQFDGDGARALASIVGDSRVIRVIPQ